MSRCNGNVCSGNMIMSYLEQDRNVLVTTFGVYVH